VTLYLVVSASGFLGSLLRSATWTGELGQTSPSEFVLLPFLVTAIVLAWVSRRRSLVLIGALPAAVVVSIDAPWRSGNIQPAVTLLVCVAALIALAGGSERPGRHWLWLVGISGAGAFVAAAAWPSYSFTAAALTTLLIAGIAVCVAWISVDARPAIAVAVYLLLVWVPTMFTSSPAGFLAMIESELPVLAVISGVTGLALWRLRRQSAHGGGPGATAA